MLLLLLGLGDHLGLLEVFAGGMDQTKQEKLNKPGENVPPLTGYFISGVEKERFLFLTIDLIFR